MLSKLLAWIDYLKMSPVDKLIAILGEDTVSIWNGITYGGNYKLALSGVAEYSCDPRVFQFIRIGIGYYYSGCGDFIGGDYEKCPVIEITIDRYLNIRNVKRNTAYYNGKSKPPKIERKIDALKAKLKIMSKLATSRSRLKTWIQAMFEIDQSIRYSAIYSAESILTTNWDRVNKIRKQIEFVATGGN